MSEDRPISLSIEAILDRLKASTRLMESGCHQWTGHKNEAGYGRTHMAGKLRYVHRLAYEASKGPIPAGLTIDHLCRNKSCINPDHLEAVTLAENIARSEGVTAIHKRKTHCMRGHLFDENNTYVNSLGHRGCRRCHRERQREKKAGIPRKKRKLPTHCRRGHAHNAENTLYRANGQQICRACKRITWQKRVAIKA